jgi:hypothetical protein
VPSPVKLHVTVLFVALVTVAVNDWLPPPFRLTFNGATGTATAGIVTVVPADFVGSATEVATTVALEGVVSVAGAV